MIAVMAHDVNLMRAYRPAHGLAILETDLGDVSLTDDDRERVPLTWGSRVNWVLL